MLIALRRPLFGLDDTLLTLLCQFSIEFSADQQNERSPIQPDHKGDKSAECSIGAVEMGEVAEVQS